MKARIQTFPAGVVIRQVPSLVVVAALLLAACSMNARLYQLSNAQVTPVKFTYSGTGRGRIQMTLHSGATCNGEYVTVAGGTTNWGVVFASVYGPGGAARGSGTAYSSSVENKQKGTAILVCSDGTAIDCEYVTAAMSVQGYGACRDNKGELYRLMF